VTKGYFVLGTDTNVGKTYVATALVQHFVQLGLKTVGMKPIASGCELAPKGELANELVNEDLLALKTCSNVTVPLDLINPYRFEPLLHLILRPFKLA